MFNKIKKVNDADLGKVILSRYDNELYKMKDGYDHAKKYFKPFLL